MISKNKYLVALPVWKSAKGFGHQTILVSATSKQEAVALVKYLKPGRNIGDVKKVGQ